MIQSEEKKERNSSGNLISENHSKHNPFQCLSMTGMCKEYVWGSHTVEICLTPSCLCRFLLMLFLVQSCSITLR